MGGSNSKQKFDDDEPIVATAVAEDDSGEDVFGVPFEMGKVRLQFENEPEIPLEETNYKLLIEVMGRETGGNKQGVDVVMVIDVSDRIAGEKLEEMKRAIQSMIKSLDPSDRLSIITFSSDPERKSKLRQMTRKAREETDILVQNLSSAKGSPNITSGLALGLKVLDERKQSAGRSGAIMLVSGSIQSASSYATKISLDHYTVFTIAAEAGGVFDAVKVPNDIAKNSEGGHLSTVLSQCLREQLSVLVQDVELVLKPLSDYASHNLKITNKINKVYARNHPQTTDPETGAVIVTFGHLYQKELHPVLVDLFLPGVPNEVDLDALKIACTYRGDSGKLTSTNQFVLRVIRTSTPNTKQSDASEAEIKRVEAVELMEANTIASRGDMRAYAIPRMRGKKSQVVPLVPSYHHSATTLIRSQLELPKTFPKLFIRRPESTFGHQPRASFVTKATMNAFPALA